MDNMCRTCLRVPQKLLPLFNDDQLQHRIDVISSIQVSANDNLPATVCEECVKNINLLYNFRCVIINSDLELRERYAALQRERYAENERDSYSADQQFSCSERKELESDHMEPENDYYVNSLTSNDVLEMLDPDIKVESLDSNCIDLYEVVVEGDNCNSKVKPEQQLSQQTTNDLKTKTRYSFKNIMTYRKRSYECKECNFVCHEKSKWQNHRRTHHYSPGICNICGKSMRMDNLQKHIKSHTELPVACKECGKVFKNSESLRSHTFIHSGEILRCKTCDKTYKYRGDYNRHMKRHVSGQPKVKCTICNKAISKKKGLKQHMQSHTGERPYPCQYCSKRFSTGYALKTHTRQHTNERPYTCMYCPMAFPQKVSLQTHLKSKHQMPAVEDGADCL